MVKASTIAALVLLGAARPAAAQDFPRPTQVEMLHIPLLSEAPRIDGDLADWKDAAFTDGVWDMDRLRHVYWFDGGRRNRLTDHGNEPRLEDDLRARYYTAWDETHFYFGAEVIDNANDVESPQHTPRSWFSKDAVCWFIEAPRDAAPEMFGQGDNSFCFVADASRPSYGAWWRHGSAQESYVEAPIPPDAVEYTIRMNPWGTGAADFILEARVEMASTLGRSDPRWAPPQVGDEYGMEIVHTDPDGGPYGGHFMIYGTGDDDATWGRMVLVGPQKPLERLPE